MADVVNWSVKRKHIYTTTKAQRYVPDECHLFLVYSFSSWGVLPNIASLNTHLVSTSQLSNAALRRGNTNRDFSLLVLAVYLVTHFCALQSAVKG